MKNVLLLGCALFCLVSWKAEEISSPQNQAVTSVEATDYVFGRTSIEWDQSSFFLDLSFLGYGALDAPISFPYALVVTYNNGDVLRFSYSVNFPASNSSISYDELIPGEKLINPVTNITNVTVEKYPYIYNGAYNIVAPDWK